MSKGKSLELRRGDVLRNQKTGREYVVWEPDAEGYVLLTYDMPPARILAFEDLPGERWSPWEIVSRSVPELHCGVDRGEKGEPRLSIFFVDDEGTVQTFSEKRVREIARDEIEKTVKGHLPKMDARIRAFEDSSGEAAERCVGRTKDHRVRLEAIEAQIERLGGISSQHSLMLTSDEARFFLLETTLGSHGRRIEELHRRLVKLEGGAE